MLTIQDYIPVTKAKIAFLDIIRKIKGSNDAIAITKNGVPEAVLTPRNTWDDQKAYEATKEKLIALFQENFRQFEAGVNAETIAAGPAS